MKARHVVGRTIVRIDQARRDDANGGPAWEIERLVLDDGSTIYFTVREQENATEYIVTAHSTKEYARRLARTTRSSLAPRATPTVTAERKTRSIP